MSKMGDRLRTIRENYRRTKEHDPYLGWVLLGLFIAILGAFIGVGAWTHNMVTWVIVGLSMAVFVLAIVFNRRALRSAYRSIEGQPGAAVAVVQSMAKRGWGVTAAVAANRHKDLVHRVVGRPGVILVGEGTSPALTGLLASERKRTARFVGEVPVNEIVIGAEPGQVPIAKLDKHLRKMNNVLSPAEVTALRRRLEALTATPVPVPKGPMPRSGRMPRGGKLR